MYKKIDTIPSIVPERPYIPTYLWETNTPKGIIHIVHGMSENAERYAQLADFLSNNGYIVLAHDHLGHGPQAKEYNRLGYFGSDDATPLLIEDMHRVANYVQQEYPSLPYFILAHSMGSFLSRIYLQKYSDSVAGILLSGTNSHSILYSFANRIAAQLNRHHPTTYNYRIHRLLFQTGLNESPDAIKEVSDLWVKPSPEEKVDWPLIGFVFTNNGFAELFKMVYLATKSGWLDTINHNLPIAIFTGRNDPLVNHGKETLKLAEEFKKANFTSVSFYMFENRGHEIFMYNGTEIVFKYALEWFNRHNSRL